MAAAPAVSSTSTEVRHQRVPRLGLRILQNDKLNANRGRTTRAGEGSRTVRSRISSAQPSVVRSSRTGCSFLRDYQGTRIASTGGAVPGLGNTGVPHDSDAACSKTETSPVCYGPQIGTDALGRPIRRRSNLRSEQPVHASDGQLVRDPFPGTSSRPAGSIRPRRRSSDPFPAPKPAVADRQISAEQLLHQHPGQPEHRSVRRPHRPPTQRQGYHCSEH